MAIITGTLAGGYLADIGHSAGIVVCVILYFVSLGASLLIPSAPGRPGIRYGRSFQQFFTDMGTLFANRRTRFALIGNGSFWMAAGVLRIAILAWIPVALKIEDPFLQTVVFASTTIGIVLGALLTPRIVNVEKFYKSVLYGFLMVAIVLLTPFIHFVAATVVCLLLIGFLGGVFIIPMNTVMQIEGQHTVGTGQTIAIQNFVENVLMIAGLVLFKLLLGSGVNITLCIVSMGLVLLLFVLYTYWEARIIKREMG
jgi:LPLT family lysophospholipid transporter-like MFS transporter